MKVVRVGEGVPTTSINVVDHDNGVIANDAARYVPGLFVGLFSFVLLLLLLLSSGRCSLCGQPI